jgi:DNA-binding response OmpR family regulator
MTSILLVEDDKDIARALKLRLSANDMDVAVAYDASTALMIARKHQPDVVLLDISMPGGDGFLVAERIAEVFGAIPIIFLTANGQQDMRQRAHAMGASGFFQKPFDTNDLLAAIGAAA